MKLFLSNNIKVLRRKRNIVQDVVAQKLNVSRQTVSKWERGKST